MEEPSPEGQPGQTPAPGGLLIDDWLPEFDVRDLATATLRGSPARAFAAAREMNVLDDSLIRGVVTLREAPLRMLDWYRGVKRAPTAPALVTFETLARGERGFVLLGEDACSPDGRHEVVLGAAGRLWTAHPVFRALTADDFRAYNVAGDARAVLGLRTEPTADGRSRVAVEFRVAPIGRAARLAFRAYWTAIGPASGLVRRRVLDRLKQEFED